MKVSHEWLKSFVDINDDIDELNRKLTFAGLEVEKVDVIGSDFEGVVVGEIIEIDQHPNADKLKLCLVDYGEKESIRVVCGAPNTRVGGKYPFATVGTTLPGGFTLKKAKIRGEISLGMLCAKDELGLGDDHSGLMELDKDLKPGTPFVNVIGKPNKVIELEITPNRPDCLSMIGIAREVAALYELPLKEIDLKEINSNVFSLNLNVINNDKCPRYTARVIRNVKVEPSPQWMQNRLDAIGIRPINNIVDITNYVMLETGHPMHAFDLKSIEGSDIIVRCANDKESFTALNGECYELTNTMMVIADKKEPLALAGVIGGKNSEIGDHTTDIILETAYFEPSSIRHTAKNLGINTDSSYRFQRGVNPQSVLDASLRATNLIMELCSSAECESLIDSNQSKGENHKINFYWKYITDKIGLDIPKVEMLHIFKKLSIEIVEEENNKALAIIPSYRLDLKSEIDLVEEIARMYGVNELPSNTPIARVVERSSNEKYDKIKGIKNILHGLGLSEIMNYSLTNDALLDLVAVDNKNERESLPHPISEDQSILRTTLIPQIVESIGRNHSRQIKEVCCYEIGKVFKSVDGIVSEFDHLSVGLFGPVGRKLLDKQSTVRDEEQFIWIKGIIEELMLSIDIRNLTFIPENNNGFKDGHSLDIFIGQEKVGFLGLISEKPSKNWKFNTPVAVAELDLALILNKKDKKVSVIPIPVYPSISRDISLVLDKEITHESIMSLISKYKPKILESVDLFDLYEGKGVQKDKKSSGYKFVYRSSVETLTDKKVNKVHDKLVNLLCNELSAEIRV